MPHKVEWRDRATRKPHVLMPRTIERQAPHRFSSEASSSPSMASGSSKNVLVAKALINQLPDEILAKIFVSTVPDDEFESRQMLEYLPLTWVCRRWRAVALDTATLWTKIDLGFVNYRLTTTILSRSKQAKLDIDPINEDFPYFHDVNVAIRILETQISSHFDRLNSLSLKFSAPRWHQLQWVLEQAAPSLRHLSLAGAPKESPLSSIGSALQSAYSKPIRFPNLLNGIAPRLETLVFHFAQSPPWPVLIPLMANLRRLKVVSTPWNLAPGVSAHGELLNALRSCPNLEFLDIETLQDMDTDESEWRTVSLEPIDAAAVGALELPHLSQVILRSSQDTSLLCHLILPRLTQLYVTLDEELSTDSALVTAITDRFNMGSLRDITIGTGCAFFGTSQLEMPTSDWSHLLDSDPEHKVSGIIPPDVHVLSIDCCCREVEAHILLPPLIKSAVNATRLTIRDGPQSLPASSWWRPLEISKEALTRETKISHLIIAFLEADIRPTLRLLEEGSICPKLETLTCVGGLRKELYVGTQIRECVRHRNAVTAANASSASRDNNNIILRRINMLHCPTMDKYCAKEIRSFDVEVSEELTEDDW